jgi:hypothetical protein
VLDVTGKVVAVPVQSRELAAGEHTFGYNTGSLRPGLYILKADLARAGQTIASRMVVVE